MLEQGKALFLTALKNEVSLQHLMKDCQKRVRRFLTKMLPLLLAVIFLSAMSVDSLAAESKTRSKNQVPESDDTITTDPDAIFVGRDTQSGDHIVQVSPNTRKPQRQTQIPYIVPQFNIPSYGYYGTQTYPNINSGSTSNNNSTPGNTGTTNNSATANQGNSSSTTPQTVTPPSTTDQQTTPSQSTQGTTVPSANNNTGQSITTVPYGQMYYGYGNYYTPNYNYGYYGSGNGQAFIYSHKNPSLSIPMGNYPYAPLGRGSIIVPGQ